MNPAKLGRFEIVRELGKGAMGVVYLARDPLIGRELALKTFRVGLSTGDEELDQFRARFLREAQSAGILSHPNIVTIHDVVEDPEDGAFFIAMEYVEGTDLKRFIQRREPLELDFIFDVAAQVAVGLGYAHSKGVVHRDVKPANIIIAGERQVKITDFGIARMDASNLTVEGQLLGTPNYMAPEQIQGREVDHRADLFSLGVLVYELITKRKPFQGDNLTMVTHRIVYDEYTPLAEFVPGLPESIDLLLQRALQKKPADRFPSGKEMARELERLRAEIAAPVPAAPVPAAPVPAASSRVDAVPIVPAPIVPAPIVPEPIVPAPIVPESIVPEPVLPALVRPATVEVQLPPPPPLPPLAPLAASPPVVPEPVAAAERSGSSLGPPAAVAGRSPWRRLAAVAAVAAVTGLGLIGGSFLLVPKPVERPLTAEERQRQEILPLVQEGRRQLEAGDPAAALEALERALALVPDDREVRQLRDQANRAVLDSGLDSERAWVDDRLKEAAGAQEAKDYARAIQLAEQVLGVDPGNERARALRDESRSAQERRRQVQERVAATSAPTGPAPPPSAASPPPAAASSEASLRIELHSEVSEGVLTVYSREQILKETFRFVEKTGGVFGRTRKTSGELVETRSLPAGDHELKVYLLVKGRRETQLQKIAGNFPGGATRVLHARVDAEGTLAVSLE